MRINAKTRYWMVAGWDCVGLAVFNSFLKLLYVNL